PDRSPGPRRAVPAVPAVQARVEAAAVVGHRVPTRRPATRGRATGLPTRQVTRRETSARRLATDRPTRRPRLATRAKPIPTPPPIPKQTSSRAARLEPGPNGTAPPTARFLHRERNECRPTPDRRPCRAGSPREATSAGPDRR